MRGPDAMTVVDDLLDIAGREGLLLLKAKDLNLVVFVFQNLELLFIVE
jgi:hypothetical protein